MAKRVDITEKLQFDENPVLVVGGEELEVNADAETMLRLMGLFSSKSMLQAMGEATELLFGAENVQKIAGMRDEHGRKLTTKALISLIEEGMNLVTGEAEGE